MLASVHVHSDQVLIILTMTPLKCIYVSINIENVAKVILFRQLSKVLVIFTSFEIVPSSISRVLNSK